MSSPGRHFKIENLLRGIGDSPCCNHQIDRGNDNLALGYENARTIAAIPDPDITASGRFGNGSGDVKNRHIIGIECLHDRPPARGDGASGHNSEMPYRELFLRLVAQSQLRKQRKINGSNIVGGPKRLTPSIRAHDSLRSMPSSDALIPFDKSELGAVLCAAALPVLPSSSYSELRFSITP